MDQLVCPGDFNCQPKADSLNPLAKQAQGDLQRLEQYEEKWDMCSKLSISTKKEYTKTVSTIRP